jgi:SAM-dependent methyltransferase
MIKLNLGCGTNVLDGWENHDAGVDITKPLPWGTDTADCIFAEHVVEHVPYNAAVLFFTECHRVLRTGGIIRIAVPSVERIWREATPNYIEFTRKWVPRTKVLPTARESGMSNSDLRDAMTNILYRHGHRAPWTQGLLLASLFYAGFDEVVARTPGQSDHVELQNVEGHGRVIGDEFNRIETVVAEGTK